MKNIEFDNGLVIKESKLEEYLNMVVPSTELIYKGNKYSSKDFFKFYKENIQDYKEKRKEMYPNIEEQIDMIFHALEEGKLDKSSIFYKTIAKIKKDIPKKGVKK